jgi:hypothetical protein
MGMLKGPLAQEGTEKNTLFDLWWYLDNTPSAFFANFAVFCEQFLISAR